jgi:hypothetical protein
MDHTVAGINLWYDLYYVSVCVCPVGTMNCERFVPDELHTTCPVHVVTAWVST